jgi:pantoate--beta-alanine ligase
MELSAQKPVHNTETAARSEGAGMRRRFLHIARTIQEMRQYRHTLSKDDSIGFIPTMGALHSGHLSLVDRARKENQIVIASIFINPTQFSPGEDLDKYPRTVEQDLEMLKQQKVDCVFLPQTSEIYQKNPLCHIEPTEFSYIYEGSKRPNFFSGVATIVCKLFNIVQPTVAYFGQKDISQFILLKRMVNDLNIPVLVKASPTLREQDGLAMSSRNVYLSPQEREASGILFKALQEAVTLCEHTASPSTLSTEEMIAVAKKILSQEPLVSEVQYISVASPHDMKELTVANPQEGAVVSAAIKVGSVRLIDNLLVGNAKKIIYG